MPRKPVAAKTKKTVKSVKSSVKKNAVKKSSVKKKPTVSRKKKISEEDVRTAAYFSYISRGGEHGRHEEDWYGAEKKLKRTAARKKKK